MPAPTRPPNEGQIPGPLELEAMFNNHHNYRTKMGDSAPLLYERLRELTCAIEADYAITGHRPCPTGPAREALFACRP